MGDPHQRSGNLGLLGRVDNDAWAAAWRQADKTPQQMHDEAADEDALLRAAIDSYAKGYRRNPSHYYSGINALTLMHLHHHLTADARYDREMANLGDLEVLVDTPNSVKTAYKEAIVNNDKDWFALNSSSAQLQMLKDLGFRPENVDAGIATFDRALQKLTQPADQWQPRQMFLSRHMAHQRSYDRNLKANTVKTRPDSLFRQGCMLYELIATMPAARLTPLMRRFGEMLLEQRLFSQMFSVV